VLAYVTDASPPWVFLAGAVGVAVLADWVRRSTEQLAAHVGQAVGGLLAISFGSLAEIILAMFVLAHGEATVVRAQITGSIIGTGLLGLGVAIVAGGVGRERQTFKRERAGLLSSLLILAVIALLLPAVFYAANLIFTLVTHRDVFGSGDAQEGGGEEGWPIWLAVAVLVGATAVIALEADLVSGALQATAGALGLSKVFLGVIVLAVVGTASDLFAAAWFARQDKMGLVLNICIGSAIQMALVVAPVLVLVSWAIGRPMTLVFDDPLDLFAIAGTAFIVNAISADGETTWFEGVLLIGVYGLLGLAFFFVG
jgi:Ca2+:H+ antiporter